MMEKGGDDHESTSTVGSFFESSINSVESSSSELVEDASSSSTSNSSLSLSASPLSRRNGPLYELSELMTNLPIKRGLSKYYDGKSESFASIERVESLENLAKRKKASFSHCNKKLKGSRSYGGGLESDDSKSGVPTANNVQKDPEVVITVVGPEFETTAMAVAPRPKRQKFDLPSSPGILPLSVSKNERNSASIRSSEVSGAVAKSSEIDLRIQQAKNNAVAQALQDGCTGSFATFDSPFGNFLLPVVPSCEELYE